MNKLLATLLIIFICSTNAFAEARTKYLKKAPDGIFKKTITGKIIQYDKNGKKIGVYKNENGRFVKIK